MFNFFWTRLRQLRIVLYIIISLTAISVLITNINSGYSLKINPNLAERNSQYLHLIANSKQFNTTEQGKQFGKWYKALYCSFIGELCTNNPHDADKNYPKSILGGMSRLITQTISSPPASGVYWVYSGLENAGFVPKSYAAQGIGLSAIQPFMGLWKIFRNIAYTFLVIVTVIIGFMIMFRTKINAQTVIGIENSLPRIVISLILITFSFAIAGFLIDLMYLFTAMIVQVLAGNDIKPYNAQDYLKGVFGKGQFLFDKVFTNGNYFYVGDAILGILPRTLDVLFRITISVISLILFSNTLKDTSVGGVITGKMVEGTGLGGLPRFVMALVMNIIFLGVIPFLVPFILSLIFFLTALFVFFRILFLLLKCYIKILLLIIFSPIIILINAIPGRNYFSTWLKNMTINLAAFPAVVGLIIISSLIVAAGNPSVSLQNTSVGYMTNPSNGIWQPPLLYSTTSDAFMVLVGVAIMFLIPDLVKALQKALGAKDSPVKAGLGVLFGGVTGIGGTAFGALGKYGSIAHGIHYLTEGSNPLNKFVSGIFKRGGKKASDSAPTGGPEGVL